MNKTWLKIVIIVLVFIAGFLLGREIALAPSDGNAMPAGTAGQPLEIKATLKLDNGSGEVKTFGDIPLAGEATVFDLLKTAAAANNFGLDYKDYGGDMGAFIISIDGIVNDPSAKEYWQFWVNGEYSKVGAGTFRLKNGDLVEWKYAAGQLE